MTQPPAKSGTVSRTSPLPSLCRYQSSTLPVPVPVLYPPRAGTNPLPSPCRYQSSTLPVPVPVLYPPRADTVSHRCTGDNSKVYQLDQVVTYMCSISLNIRSISLNITSISLNTSRYSKHFNVTYGDTSLT